MILTRMQKNILDQITELAKRHIPNKMIKIRLSYADPSWLTCGIKKLNRTLKRFYNNIRDLKGPADFEKYKHLRNKTTAKNQNKP